MSGHGPAGAKRQKLREPRTDHVDYFQVIDKIDYNKMASRTESTSYRYYNSTERIHSKTMEEWLKYSISFTEFRRNGVDNYGRATNNRLWDDNSNSIENYKRCVKAFYDFCSKLGIRYWTAFDSDLIPNTDDWDEAKIYWDEIVEFIQEMTQRSHVRLLWLAPDLHSDSRYVSGAFTSTEAVTFIQAASQIKRCLEMSQRLNAECFLLWPFREGYGSVYHTDVGREIKLFAKLLKITAEYKDRLSYRRNSITYGDIWQHSFESDLVNKYMWDVTSCLYFLKNFDLDRNYRVCTPPGHHMHMANVYNMLGGVTISNDVDHCDGKRLTLMTKCIVDMGTAPPGGINLKLMPRRGTDLQDLATSYMKYADAIAKGLRTACALIADQIFSKHLQQRYSSYQSGFGCRLMNSDISMEECEESYKKQHSIQTESSSSRLEHLDVVFQRYLDTCDRI